MVEIVMAILEALMGLVVVGSVAALWVVVAAM